MKHFFFSILLLFVANALPAQNSEGSADDAARIPIKAYVPTDIGDITPEAQSALKTRIERIITKAGLGGSSYDNRFIMTAKIAELAKEVSSTTPTIYYYELEMPLKEPYSLHKLSIPKELALAILKHIWQRLRKLWTKTPSTPNL